MKAVWNRDFPPWYTCTIQHTAFSVTFIAKRPMYRSSQGMQPNNVHDDFPMTVLIFRFQWIIDSTQYIAHSTLYHFVNSLSEKPNNCFSLPQQRSEMLTVQQFISDIFVSMSLYSSIHFMIRNTNTGCPMTPYLGGCREKITNETK